MQRHNFQKNMFSASIGTVLVSLITLIMFTACGNNTYAGSTSVAQAQPAIASPTATKPPLPGSPISTSLSSSSPSSQLPDGSLNAIRMLDQVHGWALTQHSVLKTDDGGFHWRDVSPSPNPLSAITTQLRVSPTFKDRNHALIVIPPLLTGNETGNTITIMRTTDGGVTWFTSTIIDSDVEGIMGTSLPNFITVNEGWLEVSTGVAASSNSVDIFHTIDGGAHWSKIASTGIDYSSPSGLPLGSDKTGISFKDAQTGWATAVTPMADRPLLFVTHDGGYTWDEQVISTVTGISGAQYETTPPVLFGNYGIMPVFVTGLNATRGYVYYITYNGGQSWSPTALLNVAIVNSYVVDAQHAWAFQDTNSNAIFYTTSDAGYHWTQLAATTPSIGALSFTDTLNGWAIGPLTENTGLLLHTTNGGHTWQQIPYVITPHA